MIKLPFKKKKIELTPNFSKKTRKISQIKYVILHYTGMQSEIESIKKLKDPSSKVSCHYLINKSGLIIKMVNENNIAWHAGKSKWKNLIGLNTHSIGIELVNKGHEHGYEKYPSKQITSLIKLCLFLKRKYKIERKNFLGHSDIAPLRKIDPGEKFPWNKLNKCGIGIFYKKKQINLKMNKKKMIRLFFKNLHKIGYRYFNVYKRHKNDILVVKAFQRKYNANKVTGKIDQKTFEISHYLAGNSKIS